VTPFRRDSDRRRSLREGDLSCCFDWPCGRTVDGDRDGAGDPPACGTADASTRTVHAGAGDVSGQDTGVDPAAPAPPAPPTGDRDPDRPAPPAPARKTSGKPRRAGGTLDGGVLDVCESHPDRQFKVGELCKLIDKANEDAEVAKASPGAVVLACERLVRKNKLIQVVERPATFQLAPPSGPAAA
jgi:hypothetical protein